MKILIICIVGFFLLGCAHIGKKIRKEEIHEGTTKNELISTLGQPIGLRKLGQFEYLKYSEPGTDYIFILENNKIIG